MLLGDCVDGSVVVWGAGLEGRAAARRLVALGARNVVVAIDQAGKRVDEDAREAVGLGLSVVIGDDARSSFRSADVVIASPSIPPANPHWEFLSDAGVAVTTTSDLWFAQYGHRTLAVTGSKGKSTTASLLSRVVGSVGVDVAFGGNIGVAFFDLPETADVYVVEVGSNQSARLAHSPMGGIITALFPEHLDWHGGYQEYVSAKKNLFLHGSAFLVSHPVDLGILGDLPTSLRVIHAPDQPVVDALDGQCPIAGRRWDLPTNLRTSHNLRNASLVLLAAEAYGVDLSAPEVAQAVAAYEALPHRLELVGQAAGMAWYDDSLATSPAPTLSALQVFPESEIFLIIGGKDRGLDYTPLTEAVRDLGPRAHVYAIPDNGPDLVAMINRWAPAVDTVLCEGIPEAVSRIAAAARPAGVVLFSPAAPTGDGHQDYRSRSMEFVASVRSLELRADPLELDEH
jgi:UDP-N-acetylmuramoylalanine--D-glutamate ligase